MSDMLYYCRSHSFSGTHPYLHSAFSAPSRFANSIAVQLYLMISCCAFVFSQANGLPRLQSKKVTSHHEHDPPPPRKYKNTLWCWGCPMSLSHVSGLLSVAGSNFTLETIRRVTSFAPAPLDLDQCHSAPRELRIRGKGEFISSTTVLFSEAQSTLLSCCHESLVRFCWHLQIRPSIQRTHKTKD